MDKTGLSRLWSKIKAAFCPINKEFTWGGIDGTSRGKVVFTSYNGDLYNSKTMPECYAQISVVDGVQTGITIGVDTSGGPCLKLIKNGVELATIDTQGVTINLGQYGEERNLDFIISGIRSRFMPQRAQDLGVIENV